MKIMHLLTSNRFSGAENVVCQIISLLRNEDDMQMIYCSPDGQIRESLHQKKIQFYSLESVFNEKNVKKAIKEIEPDIIHAHDMKACYVAAKVCGKIPLISHIHNNNINSRGLSLKSIAYLRAALKVKHIFWVSQSSFDGYAFHNLVKKKSEVLYNIIDVDDLQKKVELDCNSYDYDAIYLGRLTPQKNPFRFLEVCKLLIEKKNDIKIAIVGTGEMEEEIRNKAIKMGLLTNISFLGFQSNPTKILKDSKVMIMTSLWEGTPMCALEALALGTPIVSTPVDGMKVLINGDNGFLTDDNEKMAELVVKLIEDKDFKNKISKNEVVFSRTYNDSNLFRERILNVYLNMKGD